MFKYLLWTDYVLIILILSSIFLSLRKKFFEQAVSLISFGIAILAALKYGANISSLFDSIFGKGVMPVTLTIGITFIVTFIIISKIGYKIVKYFHLDKKVAIDKFLALIFGFLRGLLFAVIIVGFSIFSPYTKSNWLNTPLTSRVKVLSDYILSKFPVSTVDKVRKDIDGLQNSALVNQSKKLVNAVFGADLKIIEQKDLRTNLAPPVINNATNKTNTSNTINENEQKLLSEIEILNKDIDNLTKAINDSEATVLQKQFGRKPRYNDRQLLIERQQEVEKQKKLVQDKQLLETKKKELNIKISELNNLKK